MNRRALALAIATLMSIAPVPLGPDGARADAPPPAPARATADPKDAVGSLIKALRANKGAVRVGMAVANADRATAGAARHLDQRLLPLRGSWLDKDGRMNGIIDWDVDLDAGKKVDCIRAVLLTEPFDKKEMGKAILDAGKAVGLDLGTDPETPLTWYDEEATGVEIWVTLGEGIVLVEAQTLSD
jgi:hypothetical protein